MLRPELSSPPPLKPSHCASPPLHSSSFVRAGAAAYLSSASPRRSALLLGETAPILSQSSSGSEGGRKAVERVGGVTSRPQGSRVFPPDLHNFSLCPRRRKRSEVSTAGAGVVRGGLFVTCSPQNGWLLRLDIMRALISVAALLPLWLWSVVYSQDY